MLKFIVLSAVILGLAFSCPCNGIMVVQQQGPVKNGKPAASKPVVSPPSAVKRSVENVFVDKIEEGAIYATDGRKFETAGVKMFDNTRKKTRRVAAELFFKNGRLVEVVLK